MTALATNATDRVVSGEQRGRPSRTRGWLRLLGPILCVAGGATVCIGAAAPWLRIGQVSRSAFSLARHARELGVLRSSGARLGVDGLFFAPAVVGVLVVLLSLGWRRLGGLVASAIALVGIGAGAAGLRSGATEGAGPTLALIGGLAAAAGAVLTGVSRSSGMGGPVDAVSSPE